MKIKKIILIFLLFPLFVLGQSKTITGLVNDENGSPLPGATVQLKGSETVGAITDFDGNFSISIPISAEQALIVSYIGYLNEEVDVSNQISITVNLQPDTEALEEVVVVGYGTVLKRDLTGSVSSVKITDDVNAGLIVSTLGYWRQLNKDGTVNSISSAELADMGNAPTFSDNLVEVTKL